MSRITYVKKRFSEPSKRIIAQANSICATYASQGYDLTLRQLYYQFVSRDLISNTQQEYKRLGSIINDARLAGELDWSYIIDRTRNVAIPSSWDNPSEIAQSAARSYRRDRWEDQPYRVEVWVEKEALAGVVEQAAEHYRVPTFSCRGYTSQSELWGAAQRLGGYITAGQVPIILHLGDHDPSGIDMTRDIRDRLNMFLHQDWLNDAMTTEGKVTYSDIRQHMTEWIENRNGTGDTGLLPVEVERIALNMDQIDQYDPPPNPAKFTDSRAESYVSLYGTSSWELDALEPRVLDQLIQDRVAAYVDEDIYAAMLDREEEERGRLSRMVEILKEEEAA